MEIIEGGLLNAVVGHERVRPKHNKFSYKVYYTVFPIQRLTSLKGRLLSVNRFNIWSIYERDHGARDGSPWEPWIRTILDKQGVAAATTGDIVIMTFPRLLGYGFNPISFWFCLDKEGGLRAVLCEVNNTFNDYHNYLIAHSDLRPILKDDAFTAPKKMYVSPFNDVEGEYKFRFNYSKDKIQVWIEYWTEDALKVSTYVGGDRTTLSDSTLLTLFFTRPLMTLFVIGRIHWQAVRLWFKGVKPALLPTHESGHVTRAQD